MNNQKTGRCTPGFLPFSLSFDGIGATRRPLFPVYKDKNTREGEEKGEAAEMVLRDQEILSLCRARDQRAIAALAEKYGAYCHTVAHNILGDHPDAEECVNDAYLAVWNGVPSAPPRSLLAYLAKVTRNIALKRLEHNQAQKRGRPFLSAAG